MDEVRPKSVDPDLEARWSAIERQLEEASGLLSAQGSIGSRMTGGGSRVFSVRFVEEDGGRRRQRAVYLGRDGELVTRARALLGEYRERGRMAEEVEEMARFVAASGSLMLRMMARSPRPRLPPNA